MKAGFIFFWLALSFTFVMAQNFAKQGISFTLLAKDGTRVTDEAILNGTVKIYSLRETKVAKEQALTYNKENKQFTFTETAASPGISLALVSSTDTMYISLFGRPRLDRVIDGINLQRGSYILTSNEFGSNKYFKVDDWSAYLEDEVQAAKQDLSAYAHQLKSKNPITLVQAKNN